MKSVQAFQRSLRDSSPELIFFNAFFFRKDVGNLNIAGDRRGLTHSPPYVYRRSGTCFNGPARRWVLRAGGWGRPAERGFLAILKAWPANNGSALVRQGGGKINTGLVPAARPPHNGRSVNSRMRAVMESTKIRGTHIDTGCPTTMTSEMAGVGAADSRQQRGQRGSDRLFSCSCLRSRAREPREAGAPIGGNSLHHARACPTTAP